MYPALYSKLLTDLKALQTLNKNESWGAVYIQSLESMIVNKNDWNPRECIAILSHMRESDPELILSLLYLKKNDLEPDSSFFALLFSQVAPQELTIYAYLVNLIFPLPEEIRRPAQELQTRMAHQFLSFSMHHAPQVALQLVQHFPDCDPGTARELVNVWKIFVIYLYIKNNAGKSFVREPELVNTLCNIERSLIAKGFVDQRLPTGQLHELMSLNFLPGAAILLNEAGFDVNVTVSTYGTPLHRIVEHGFDPSDQKVWDKINFLLSYGADLIKVQYRKSPLERILKTIIKRGEENCLPAVRNLFMNYVCSENLKLPGIQDLIADLRAQLRDAREVDRHPYLQALMAIIASTPEHKPVPASTPVQAAFAPIQTAPEPVVDAPKPGVPASEGGDSFLAMQTAMYDAALLGVRSPPSTGIMDAPELKMPNHIFSDPNQKSVPDCTFFAGLERATDLLNDDDAVLMPPLQDEFDRAFN